MKRLEKLMTYDEVQEYFNTHPKYALPKECLSDSPYTGILTEEEDYSRFTSSEQPNVSYSKLMKYPVYRVHSEEYQQDLEKLSQTVSPIVVEFIRKYL